MNYVITTWSQRIYTRAYLLLYLLSGGTGALLLSAWHLEPRILSNESGISARRCPEGFRGRVVDSKLFFEVQ